MIHILTGPVNSGKTTALEDWIKNRKNVSGILSPNKEKRYFFDISNQEVFQMECSEDTVDRILVGRYCFSQESFSKANSIVLGNLAKGDSGFLILDELGKLELDNQGLYPAIRQSIDELQYNKKRHLLVVIRDYLVDDAINTLGIKNYQIIKKQDLKNLS